jgi:hypothetical protein
MVERKRERGGREREKFMVKSLGFLTLLYEMGSKINDILKPVRS